MPDSSLPVQLGLIDEQPIEFIVTGPPKDKQAENDWFIDRALDEAGIVDENRRAWLKLRTDLIWALTLRDMVLHLDAIRAQLNLIFERLDRAE